MTEEHVPDVVRPNQSLRHFAESQLAEPGEWGEYLRVMHAVRPKFGSRLVPDLAQPSQMVVEHFPENQADHLLWKELHDKLVARFRDKLSSGEWSVLGIAKGKASRETIAWELAANAGVVSFLNDTIGTYSFIEIERHDTWEQMRKLVWFIEQFCDVVPPKQGVGKPQVEELASRLLPFHIGADTFKVAWREAKVPPRYRKSGP